MFTKYLQTNIVQCPRSLWYIQTQPFWKKMIAQFLYSRSLADARRHIDKRECWSDDF